MSVRRVGSRKGEKREDIYTMNKKVTRLTLLVAAAALLLMAQPAASQNDIPITDLGPLLGGSPTDVNDLGQVVGYDNVLGTYGRIHFLWTPESGRQNLLGAGSPLAYLNEHSQVCANIFVGGDPSDLQARVWDGGEDDTPGTDLGGGYSMPRDMNDVKEVVGDARTEEGLTHAFRWAVGTVSGLQDLSTLGGSTSRALAINELGWIVGESLTADGENHAFLWTRDGDMTDLGTLGGDYSRAEDVNELGQVVGTSSTGAGEDHAFLWSSQGGMVDLGTLGGDFSRASDISESGHIVGLSTTSGGEDHAFIWTPDARMQDLGTLGGLKSDAEKVNNSGYVVGYSYLATGARRGFVWIPGSGMMELAPLPDGTATNAVDINNYGQIAGWSNKETGERNAVVWVALLSPEAQIGQMLDIVSQLLDDGVLNKGNANALTQKLENALAQLESENSDAVCGMLQAFVNQVEAYVKTGRLPEDVGAQLIEAANSVMEQACS